MGNWLILALLAVLQTVSMAACVIASVAAGSALFHQDVLGDHQVLLAMLVELRYEVALEQRLEVVQLVH